jgi:hypothetical protein
VVSVDRAGGLMRIVATAWSGGDDRHYLELFFETTVGAGSQLIGPGRSPYASISAEFVASWIASGETGSGTITLDSLTENRATGSFSFTGVSGPSVTPPARVVRNGRFDVSFR